MGVVSRLHQVGELSPAGGQETQQGGRSSAAAGGSDLLTHPETFIWLQMCLQWFIIIQFLFCWRGDGVMPSNSFFLL